MKRDDEDADYNVYYDVSFIYEDRDIQGEKFANRFQEKNLPPFP